MPGTKIQKPKYNFGLPLQTGSTLEHSFKALLVCVPTTLPQPPAFACVEFKEQPEMQAHSPLKDFSEYESSPRHAHCTLDPWCTQPTLISLYARESSFSISSCSGFLVCLQLTPHVIPHPRQLWIIDL